MNKFKIKTEVRFSNNALDALNEIYDTASLDVQVGSWKQIALLTNESENLIPTPTPNPKIYCDLLVKFCESEEVEPKYVSFSVVGKLFTTGDTYLPTVIVNWMQDRFDVSKTYVILSATCRVVYEQESEEEE